MKTVLRTVLALLISLSMLGYMMASSVLFAVDLSLDENHIKNTLRSSDTFASLVESSELSMGTELENHTEDVMEGLGGNPDAVSPSYIYCTSESTALIADMVTGIGRFVLYGEEYTEVNKELIQDYLRSLAGYTGGHELSEAEMDDFLSVTLESFAGNFNNELAELVDMISREPETLSAIRFIFTDVKLIAIAAAVLHMLILLLIIRGKIGYYFNAAVFGVTGLFLFSTGNLPLKILSRIFDGPLSYASLLSEILTGRFQLIGAILFALCVLLTVIGLAGSIRKARSAKQAQE